MKMRPLKALADLFLLHYDSKYCLHFASKNTWTARWLVRRQASSTSPAPSAPASPAPTYPVSLALGLDAGTAARIVLVLQVRHILQLLRRLGKGAKGYSVWGAKGYTAWGKEQRVTPCALGTWVLIPTHGIGSKTSSDQHQPAPLQPSLSSGFKLLDTFASSNKKSLHDKNGLWICHLPLLLSSTSSCTTRKNKCP